MSAFVPTATVTRLFSEQTLTSLSLKAGEHVELVVSNKGTDGYVVVDAVQLVRISALP